MPFTGYLDLPSDQDHRNAYRMALDVNDLSQSILIIALQCLYFHDESFRYGNHNQISASVHPKAFDQTL